MSKITLHGRVWFRDVLSEQRFTVQQLSDLTGPMRQEALLAFWFFLAHHAASNVAIIIPPDASYLGPAVS